MSIFTVLNKEKEVEIKKVDKENKNEPSKSLLLEEHLENLKIDKISKLVENLKASKNTNDKLALAKNLKDLFLKGQIMCEKYIDDSVQLD